MQGFEKAFSDFIDDKKYDEAEAALFTIVRAAFKAGWLAAGASLPPTGGKDTPLPPFAPEGGLRPPAGGTLTGRKRYFSVGQKSIQKTSLGGGFS